MAKHRKDRKEEADFADRPRPEGWPEDAEKYLRDNGWEEVPRSGDKERRRWRDPLSGGKERRIVVARKEVRRHTQYTPVEQVLAPSASWAYSTFQAVELQLSRDAAARK